MRLVQAFSCPVLVPPTAVVALPGTDLQAAIVGLAGPLLMGLAALFAAIDIWLEPFPA